MEDKGWRKNKFGGWFNIFFKRKDENRYVGGKKIVQGKDETLDEAMKKSGKFKTEKQLKKEEIAKKVDEKIKSTETSMKDAKGRNSLMKHMGPDGKLSPEREALHQEIIKEYFKGKMPVEEGKEKLYYMTGGGSGTGKSNFVKNEGNRYFGKNFRYDEKTGQFKGNMIKIDADDIKKMIYDRQSDGRKFSAPYLHEESSALSKRINGIATDMGYHVMLDSTGDGSPEKLGGKIDDAHSKGYKVIGCYGTCDVQKALDNNLNRYYGKKLKGDKTARYVSEKEVVSLHSNVSKTLIADANKFDKVTLYDMNDYHNIKKIASGGKGKNLRIEKGREIEYNNFASKGDMTKQQIKDIAGAYAEKVKKEGRRPR